MCTLRGRRAVSVTASRTTPQIPVIRCVSPPGIAIALEARAPVCESEWNDYIAEGLAEITTLNNQIYVFGKRQSMKPARKQRTPASQVCKKKEQPKLDTADNVQARTIKGIFMFCSAARTVTESKRSLPTLQELSSHLKPVGNHVKTTKNPGR